MNIKIVGAFEDHEEVDVIKKASEIFLIEQRIKGLSVPKKSEE